MIDTHTHTNFSGDSRELPENMIKAAIDKGLKYLAITDHVDRDYLFGEIRQTKQVDMAQYVPAIAELKEKYKNIITIGIGAEFGYTAKANRLYQEICNQHPNMDIIINSVHTIKGRDAYFPEFFDNIYKETAYMQYLEAVLESIKVNYTYDVISHLGYVTRNAPYADKAMHYKDYRDIIDTILKEIISRGKALEINTRSLSHNSQFMPCTEIVERFIELKGEYLTFASDAHTAEQVHNKFNLVRDYLLSHNFNYITAFIAHEPVLFKL